MTKSANDAPQHRFFMGATRSSIPQRPLSMCWITAVWIQIGDFEMRRQTAMTNTDPQEAWQAALATSNPHLRMRQLFRVAAAWANNDPRTAIEALASLTENHRSSRSRTPPNVLIYLTAGTLARFLRLGEGAGGRINNDRVSRDQP